MTNNYLIVNLSLIPDDWAYYLLTRDTRHHGHLLGDDIFPNNRPYYIRLIAKDREYGECPKVTRSYGLSSMCGGTQLSVYDDEVLKNHLSLYPNKGEPEVCVCHASTLNHLKPESNFWKESPDDYMDDAFLTNSSGIIRHVVFTGDSIDPSWDRCLERAWKWKEENPDTSWGYLHQDLEYHNESVFTYAAARSGKIVTSVLQIDAFTAREERAEEGDGGYAPEECRHCDESEWTEEVDYGEWYCNSCECYYETETGCCDDEGLDSDPSCVMEERPQQKAHLDTLSDPALLAPDWIAGEYDEYTGNLYNLKRRDMRTCFQNACAGTTNTVSLWFEVVAECCESSLLSTSLVHAFLNSADAAKTNSYSSPLHMVLDVLNKSTLNSIFVSSNMGDPYAFRYTTGMMYWMLENEERLEECGVGLLHTDHMATNPNENYHFIHSVTAYIKDRGLLVAALETERIRAHVREHLALVAIADDWIKEKEETQCAA